MTGDVRALALAIGRGNAYAGTAYAPIGGDTHHVCVVDPLLLIPVILTVRVRGVVAAVLDEPGGAEAANAMAGLLPLGAVVTLRQVTADKLAGRVLARVTTAAGVDVGQWLIGQGLAVAWDGRGPRPAVPWPPPA
jgi:hypothetical protein